MKVSKLLSIGMIILFIPSISGCWMLAAGGVGAYGGYKANEAGYTLQNPITKKKPVNEVMKD